jgi:glycosyltransferase involved in cell wall biosynthesis
MQSPTLDELPNPKRRTGWPWSEATLQFPETMPDGRPWPKISIITANYNYGQFLEGTIRSVLLQGYPNLEYILIDGGSTDGSVDIIRKYEPWLTYWVSERDNGHVDAINKGLQYVTGEWFNWLNSDDLLLPGSLQTVAMLSRLAPQAQWISGANIVLSEDGTPVNYYAPWRHDPTVLGFGWPNFPQDATFVRMDFMRQSGIELHNLAIFDTVFYWELIKYGLPLLTSTCLSAMRWHPGQVTADIARRGREIPMWLAPHRDAMPQWIKLWYRLLKKRFISSLFRRLLAFCVWYGVLSTSRKWQAVVYDQRQYQWKLMPAHRAVFY